MTTLSINNETHITLVTFHLAQEVYGLPIESVREVLPLQESKPIPQASHYVAGMIELRNHILPVIDLRKRLAIQNADNKRIGNIVILEINQKLLGVIVDKIFKTVTITEKDKRAVPDMILKSKNHECLHYIATIEDLFIVAMNPEKIIQTAEHNQLEHLSKPNNDHSISRI